MAPILEIDTAHRDRSRDGEDRLLVAWKDAASITALSTRRGGGFDLEVVLPVDAGKPGAFRLADIARGMDRTGRDSPDLLPVAGGLPEAQDLFLFLRSLAAHPVGKDFLEDRIRPETLPEIRVMAWTGANTGEWLNHLHSGNMRARLQAARAFPLLGDALLRDRRLFAAVDAEEPLLPVIGQVFGITPAETRRLSRINRIVSDTLGKGIPDGPMTLDEALAEADRRSFVLPWIGAVANNHSLRRLKALCQILRDQQVPEDADTLKEMMQTFDRAEGFIRVTGIAPDPVVRLLRQPRSRDDWIAARSRLGTGTQDLVRDYLREVSTSLMRAMEIRRIHAALGFDMAEVSGAVTQILAGKKDKVPEAAMDRIGKTIDTVQRDLGSWRTHQKIDAMKILISRDDSLKDIMARQERWHHRADMIRNAAYEMSESLSWKPLVGTVDLGGGIVAREITSSGAMDRQGRLEQHCVGSYTATVLNVKPSSFHLIFSIETREGRILSTVEMAGSAAIVDGREDGTRFEILQHKATRNAEPGPEAKRAVRTLHGILSGLREEKIQAYRKGILYSEDLLRDRIRKEILRFGVNFFNPDIPKTILASLQPVLPDGLVGRSLATIERSVEPLAAGSIFTGIMDRISLSCTVRIDARPVIQADTERPRQDWAYAALHAAGMVEVMASFSGGGDTGGLDEIAFLGRDGISIPEKDCPAADCRVVFPNLRIVRVLDEVIDDLAERAMNFGDYANNEGGRVEISVTLDADGIHDIEGDFEAFEPDYEEDYEDDDYGFEEATPG